MPLELECQRTLDERQYRTQFQEVAKSKAGIRNGTPTPSIGGSSINCFTINKLPSVKDYWKLTEIIYEGMHVVLLSSSLLSKKLVRFPTSNTSKPLSCLESQRE